MPQHKSHVSGITFFFLNIFRKLEFRIGKNYRIALTLTVANLEPKQRTERLRIGSNK